LLGEEIYPIDLLRQSEFYNDYLRPAGCEYTLTAVLSRTHDQALIASAVRGHRRDVLDDAEKQLTEVLAPHLVRAYSIQEKIGLSLASEALLHENAAGLVFLSEAGKAVYANRMAEVIFASNDGLTLRNAKLHAAGAVTNAALEQAVTQAAKAGDSLDCPKVVLVERKSMKPAYQVTVTRIRHDIRALYPTPWFVVVISDPEQSCQTQPALLIQLYGLTPKEAELATRLSAGKTVEASSAELNISYETARTHLRRIFDKTGVSRQTELVLLLRGLPKQVLGS
jgi:DNA-binding CsgD family transcriptional regulator